jgi:hypothetical protein
MDVPGTPPEEPRRGPDPDETAPLYLTRPVPSPTERARPDAFQPYIAPPVARRRRGDWRALVIALVLSALVMVGCCLAGFAVFIRNGR